MMRSGDKAAYVGDRYVARNFAGDFKGVMWLGRWRNTSEFKG